MSDDNDEGMEGFGLPLGSEGVGRVLAHMSAAHERQHMEHDSFQAQVYAFLDELAPQQLLVLRKMLAADPESKINNYFEGMIVTIMRIAHSVDPDTGLTPEEALAEAELKRQQRTRRGKPE